MTTAPAPARGGRASAASVGARHRGGGHRRHRGPLPSAGGGDLAKARTGQPCRQRQPRRTWTPTHSAAAPTRSSPTSSLWPRPVRGAARWDASGSSVLKPRPPCSPRPGRQHAPRRHLRAGPALRCGRREGQRAGRSRNAAWCRRGAPVGPRHPGRARAAAQPWWRVPADAMGPAAPAWRPLRVSRASTRSVCPPCGGRRAGARRRRSGSRAGLFRPDRRA